MHVCACVCVCACVRVCVYSVCNINFLYLWLNCNGKTQQKESERLSIVGKNIDGHSNYYLGILLFHSVKERHW